MSPPSAPSGEYRPPRGVIASAQPGGGVCYEIELAWGRWRRRWLKRFRAGYVEKMARLRHGDAVGAPHEVLDPRDLKFCRMLCTARWDPADDPFQWRSRLPFARWGLAELQLMGWPLLALTLAMSVYYWPLAIVPGISLGLVLYFFRNPARAIPAAPGLLVSPADGTIAEVVRLDHDEFLGRPALRIGIFLSIFNVHINRVPTACRVVELRYFPGKFLNALLADSAIYNENMWIGLEELNSAVRPRKMIVRQIAGAIARRIVCDLKSGDELPRGEKFGMIKLGSRTELIVPWEELLTVNVKVGDKVKGGSSVLAKYEEPRS